MIGAMVRIGNLKSPLVGDRDLNKLALSRICVSLYGRVRRYQMQAQSVRLLSFYGQRQRNLAMIRPVASLSIPAQSLPQSYAEFLRQDFPTQQRLEPNQPAYSGTHLVHIFAAQKCVEHVLHLH